VGHVPAFEREGQRDSGLLELPALVRDAKFALVLSRLTGLSIASLLELDGRALALVAAEGWGAAVFLLDRHTAAADMVAHAPVAQVGLIQPTMLLATEFVLDLLGQVKVLIVDSEVGIHCDLLLEHALFPVHLGLESTPNLVHQSSDLAPAAGTEDLGLPVLQLEFKALAFVLISHLLHTVAEHILAALVPCQLDRHNAVKIKHVSSLGDLVATRC